ncbi:oxidoreductase [Dictyobacter sp. S3.2.2.5]|uniref:Oxidoreductase n=1 Tax=Dictyobacter halimunensis TaxID=3026934 RepID=A0ABQ6FZV3_9CHLR|nr:oxidoreductase [Dictyobacter sp. S3.2.2.5]
MSRYRAAIIGTGGIAGNHIKALHDLKDRVEVVAAVDVVPERVEEYSKKNGIPHYYTDAAEMLEKEHPDLVHIATPPNLHYPLIIQALKAGASVLCEKPLCTSLAELDHIAEVEQQSGKFCSSVFQWRFGSRGQHFKQLIQQEALGRPLVGVCQTTWFRNAAYYEVPWRGKWSTEGGGPTMGHGIHAMDFFLWLMGDWQEVSAFTDTLDRSIEVEDVSLAMVRFQNRTLGSIVNSVLSPREETYFRFDFQKATVELTALYSYTNDNWRFTQPKGQEDAAVTARWNELERNQASSHKAQLSMLLDSMDHQQRPISSTTDIRPTLDFLTSIYKSAATRQIVQRGSIVAGDPFYEHVSGTQQQKA